MIADFTDNQEEIDGLSTGTFQPQPSWFSRSSQPYLKKCPTSKSKFKPKYAKDKQNQQNTTQTPIQKYANQSKRQFQSMKQRIYLFEYDMIQLKNQNKELKETINNLIKNQQLFQRMFQMKNKHENIVEQTGCQLKIPKETNSNLKNGNVKQKNTMSSPRLKKVKSQQFLKKKITSKMSRLQKLTNQKKSLYCKNM